MVLGLGLASAGAYTSLPALANVEARRFASAATVCAGRQDPGVSSPKASPTSWRK